MKTLKKRKTDEIKAAEEQQQQSVLVTTEPEKPSQDETSLLELEESPSLLSPSRTSPSQSMASVSEVEQEDELLFHRLKNRIKGKWDKIIEKYPQGFFRPKTIAEGPDSQEKQSLQEESPLELASRFIDDVVDMDPFARSVKSIFLLAAFSTKLDEDSFKLVPLISTLLQINVSRELSPSEQSSRDASLFSTNPTFSISCRYGSTHWTIHRKLMDIFRLHTILVFRSFQGLLSRTQLPHFPNQFSYLVDASMLATIKRDLRGEQQPKLLEERRSAVESYLRQLLADLNLQAAPELCEFFEFSGVSPTCRGFKGKEGYLKNRIFGLQSRKGLCYSWLPGSCPIKCRKYQTKWFVLRSSYLLYLDHISQVSPSDVMLIDQHFRVEVENERSKNPLKPFRLTIRNGSKLLEVRPENSNQMPFWLGQLDRLSIRCPWSRPHRYNSFAPVREGCGVNWLIDGEEFFGALVKSLDSAKKEIFIHGWWISPEIHLVRPSSLHPNYRLDRLLQACAERGIRISIVVYKELSLALPIDSYHTKTALEALHPNIRVQRHPDHLTGGVLYWARHEKLVIVDQSVAFIGGIDLAFGRFDNCLHKLVDRDGGNPMWLGQDYSNPRIKDYKNVQQHSLNSIDRDRIPRMPWHDVHCQVYGQVARDLGRHFIQSWNYVKSEKGMSREDGIPFLLPLPDFPKFKNLSSQSVTGSDGSDLEELGEKHEEDSDDLISSFSDSSSSPSFKCQVIRSAGEWSLGCPNEASIYEAYIDCIEKAERFIYIENQFLITQSANIPNPLTSRPSTPLSNNSGTIPAAYGPKNRIGAALVERILRAHRQGHKFRVIVVMPLFPAFEAAVDSPEGNSLRMIMQAQYSSISKGPGSIIGRLQEEGIDEPEQYISFFSLRAYGQLTEGPVTEQCYVHSKLAIFDDEKVIIGSANINDRSLLGMRDSEVALIMEESALSPSTTHCSGKIRELRLRLWQEHLGLHDLGHGILDPLDDAIYFDLIRNRAARNTQIYRELFHCVPDDYVETWSEYALFVEKPRVSTIDPETWNGIDVMGNLKLVRGHLVLFPMNFLKKEALSATMLSAHYLLPTEVYM